MAQDTFLSFGLGFGVFLRDFVLPTPPAQCRAMVWVIGPLYWDTGLCFSCSSLLRPADPPPLGRGDALGNFATPTVAQDYVIFLLFGGII